VAEQPRSRVENLRSLLDELRRLPPVRQSSVYAQIFERDRAIRQFERALARHATVTQATLWAQVRQVPGGPQLLAEALGAKQAAEIAIQKMRFTAEADQRHDRLLAELVDSAGRYLVLEEEAAARLGRTIGEERLAELTGSANRKVRWAPTRAHPDLPTGPAAARLLGPVVGALDRARDHLDELS
jgi:hypothetical protein